jgi:two-component system CheB/CheR fusion protein
LNHLIQDIERGQAPGPIETVRRCKDGRLVEVSLMLSPVRSASGTLVALSSIARDIGERKRLETEVLLAGDREQCRIAQDLHDGLGQQLAGISCLSNTLQKELERKASAEAASVAAKISRLLNVAVAQTRALAHGLYPVVTEPNGLMDALRGLAAGITEIFKVPCHFECPQPIFTNDYTRATHLYRIAQEASNNSIKHGRARRIRIALAATPDRLILTVDDDGIGFSDNVSARKGRGLKIMEDRACLMGGTFAVERNPEGGTRVICALKKIDPTQEISE